MPARTAQTVHSPQKLQRELADLQLVMRARNGDDKALDELIRRYSGFVRLKASSDRKSTRLNSSHGYISYAVFCSRATASPTRSTCHGSDRKSVV